MNAPGAGRWAVLALAATGCATAPVLPVAHRPASPLLVDVTILPDDAGRAGGLSLRYCLPAPDAPARWPRRLAPEHPAALRFVVAATDEDGEALPRDVDGIRTHAARGCVRVVVDAGSLADAMDDRSLGARVGDDVVLSPDVWLLRAGEDDRPKDGPELLVRLEPSSFSALLPWPLDARKGRSVVDGATYRLKSETAFGSFPIDELDVGGARIRVARLDDGRAPALLLPWMESAARAVALVHGRFPMQQVNVLIIPTRVTRPVVVGFFSRGGGATVTLVVGEDAAEIGQDDLDASGRWTITHELAHALLPPVAPVDAWFSEGFTTWHQDLLARRAGIIATDESYWHSLMRGLETGRLRAEEDGLSLQTASARMHELGSFQHAYWGGAALMLLAEVEARRRGSSLEHLAVALRNAWPDDRARAVHELVDGLSEGPGRTAGQILLSTWEAHRTQSFPDVDALLGALGVEVWPDGSVHLDDDAPLAPIRRAITRTVADSS